MSTKKPTSLLFVLRKNGFSIWSRFWEIREERWNTLKNLRFFKTFFKKNQEAEVFLKKFFNEKVSKDSTQLLARTKVFRISFQFWGKSITSYEKMGNFSNFFFIPLFAQKNRSKKNSTSLLVLNAAYWALVQITKPWTAYLFSVLRYRGSSIK